MRDSFAYFGSEADTFQIRLADPKSDVFVEERVWGSITRDRKARDATQLEIRGAVTVTPDLLAMVPKPERGPGRHRSPIGGRDVVGRWTRFDGVGDIVWIRLRSGAGYAISEVTPWGSIGRDEAISVPLGVEIPGRLPSSDLLDALPDPPPPSPRWSG